MNTQEVNTELFQEEVEILKRWVKEAQPVDVIGPEELTNTQLLALEEYAKDPKSLFKIWTETSTCEDNLIQEGVHFVGDIPQFEQEAGGCGCWQIQSFWVTKNTFDEAFIRTTMYRICPDCDPTGEIHDEGETPENTECDRCEGDGTYTEFLDEHVEIELDPKFTLNLGE